MIYRFFEIFIICFYHLWSLWSFGEINYLSPFCWLARGNNLIRNRQKWTFFSHQTQKLLWIIQQETVNSLTPCRGHDRSIFFYNIYVNFYGWWCEMMLILHGDGVQYLSPISNKHELITANRLPAMSIRGVILGFDHSFFNITTRSRDTSHQSLAV